MASRTVQLVREIALAYLSMVGLLLLAYFLVGSTTPFAPERYGLFHGFSRWPEVSPTVIPAIIILYGIIGWLTITALARLGGRLPRRKDVIFFLLTTAVFFLCYMVLLILVYGITRPITRHFMATGITETPLLVTYGIALLVTGLGWKYLTFIKFRTRIRYFRMTEPSLRPRILISGFRGPHTLRTFGYFLLVVFVIGVLPIGLLMTGILLQHPLILAASIITGLAVFSYGYFFLIVQIWNRTDVEKKSPKKTGKQKKTEKQADSRSSSGKNRQKKKGEDKLPPSEEND